MALLAVIATLLLAGTLAAGGRGRRALAAVQIGPLLAAPFVLGSGPPFLRFVVALLAFWGAVRVVDLCREVPARHWPVRLWHLFAVFDTRAVTRVPGRRDGAAFIRALVLFAVAAVGLGLVLVAAHLGYAHTAARWLGGAAFVYGSVGGLAELMAVLYLLGGLVVPPIQRQPVASRTLGEFWGQRWNRVVSGWLHGTFFRPLARRGRGSAGLLLAFLVSAAFHGYVAAAAGGGAVAIPMAAFFVLQGILLLLERALRVERWPPGLARAWFWVAMTSSLPLFLEPMLAIVAPPVA